ncbi:hypothetical protein AS888_07510, partial [Peribacillus simplex]
MKIHIVQKGDTLWKLAKKYGVSFEELKKVNAQLSNPDMMMPGMKIKIPGTTGAVIKETIKPNIHMGVKESQIQQYPAQPAPMKEQQMMQPPVKEQPKYQPPMKEQPKYQPPMKEQPKYQPPMKEQPKYQPPMKEQPKYQPPMKEQPKYQPPMKEQPKYQPPMKEQPKPIVKEKQIIVPKEVQVPTPVIPEVDINNYYMVNMTNMSVQKPPAPPPLPKKEEPVAKKKKKKKPDVSPSQEYCEPVDDCIPMTPIMPGTGYNMQPPPWAHMPMQGMQAPYHGGYGNQETQGYQMMDESSEIWGESPDMQSMGPQGYVQGASMNPYNQQQHYPYQASAPMPHHFYGGMMGQQHQVAGSYMQQDHESPSESPYNHHNHPQQSEDEEDCGCNKGLLGTYGPEVKGQYQPGQSMNAYEHHHPDYHQYQSDQSQPHYHDPNLGAYPQMGNPMQYQYETESAESDQAQQYQPFVMPGQNGGQPGMMMGGQNGGQPGMMMGGQNGGQPGMMMGGQNGGQPGMMMPGQNGGQPGMMMGGQNGGQPGMMGGQNGGQPGMMMGGQNGGQPGMMGGQNGGQPGMMGGQNGGQPGMMMGGQNGGQLG